MNKLIRVWGAISMLSLCLLIAKFQEPIKEDPLKWETIPEIVETEKIEPSVIREHEHIIHYKPIEPEYQCREVTQKEAQLLMRVAQAEAGNQGIEGMMLIMQVILNRVDDPSFPNTIEEVITMPGQFQTVSNGTYLNVTLSAEVHMALAEVEKGIPYDESIIGFETVSNGKSLEQYFAYAYTKGGHNFYVSR